MMVPIHDGRHYHIQHGVGRADPQEHQSQKEEHGPEIGTRHSSNGSWISEEPDLKCAQPWGVTWVDVQVADNAKDGESGNCLKEAIAAHDYGSVLDGVSAISTYQDEEVWKD